MTSDFTDNITGLTDDQQNESDTIEQIEQEIDQIFGKKYNFEVTIDPTSKSGLKGLPANLEDRILGIFSK